MTGMTRMVSGFLLLAMLVAGVPCAQAATPAGYDATIKQAESLIQKGNSGKAYALLEPLESRLAGNVRYDYLLGVSGVNAGKSSRAVFALERVKAVNPNYRNIGLWLAIAYYDSGDRERARAGFEAVASGGDAASRRKAQRYLATMDEEDAGKHGSLTGKLDFGFGRDSNITNLSPDYASAQQYAAAVPAPASNQASMESILGAQVEGRMPYSGGYLFASAGEERRDYAGNRNMTSNMVIARAGVNSISGRDTYRFSVMQRQFRQLGAFYNLNGLNNDYIITGVEANAKLQKSDNSYVGLYVQYSQIRFDVNTLEDTNQLMGGLSYTRTFQVSGSPILYLGYAHYLNQALQSKTPMNITNTPEGEMSTDAGRQTDVATLYLQYALDSDLDLYSTNFYYYRRDTGAYARSATIAYGEDNIRYLSLGANWRFRPKWSMRGQLAKTVDDSNIAFYSYRKTEATLIFRREFN